jgi:hypothetical protein
MGGRRGEERQGEGVHDGVMNPTPPASPNGRDSEGVFQWLAHESGPDDDAHRDAPPLHDRAHDRVPTVPTHVRLDPLTVQGVINRVLVFVLCLIAIAAAFQAVGAMTSSRVPRSTNVSPSPVPTTARTGTSVAHRKPSPAVADHPTPTTAPVALATVPVTSAPVTAPPQTAPPQTTPQRTNPPATFPPPPQTTPPQTIQVPSTPTTHATGPTDSVAVPFK